LLILCAFMPWMTLWYSFNCHHSSFKRTMLFDDFNCIFRTSWCKSTWRWKKRWNEVSI